MLYTCSRFRNTDIGTFALGEITQLFFGEPVKQKVLCEICYYKQRCLPQTLFKT